MLLLCLMSQATAQTIPDSNASNRQIITRFFQQQAQVTYLHSVSLNPAGTKVVWNTEDADGSQAIYVKPVSTVGAALRISAAADNKTSHETEPQWSPDGTEIAFLSDALSCNQLQVFIAEATTGKVKYTLPIAKSEGYASHLKWSPDGQFLSVLFVEKASREPSPMAAENRLVGLIDSLQNHNIQSLRLINRASGQATSVTPQGLYIFEYDWSPNSKQFAYTAAAPPGDDNWYIAQLFTQSIDATEPVLVYHPQWQIALPRWSPDGKRLAFIEGLMSDQGGTGGELKEISLQSNTRPRNLTPGRNSTPAWFSWLPGNRILFTEFTGGSVAINTLTVADQQVQQLWKADASIHASGEEMSISIAGNTNVPVLAFIHSSWNNLPEIWYGPMHKPEAISSLNTGKLTAMPKARNIEWVNEGFKVQGWLLYPANYDSMKKYPMLVSVHGGPAWITTPTWSAPDFNTTVYTQLGYFVFFPNPRGSYGQGEAFTLANRRDWGFGDLRDIITGLDKVVTGYPVDANRIGILGWSYGGSTTMFAVTQTKRFRAAVAGAGAGDWLSYYGQNSIDKWMWPYFGKSPYDDPAVYAKSSAMTYIHNVTTPTLLLVGERDGEAPPPQSVQYWHALKERHVPTQLMIYADEGHSFSSFENRIDICLRSLEWFNTYLKK